MTTELTPYERATLFLLHQIAQNTFALRVAECGISNRPALEAEHVKKLDECLSLIGIKMGPLTVVGL